MHNALDEIGIKPREIRKKHLFLKENFKESEFFKTQKIYLNERYATFAWDENLMAALPACLQQADLSASQVAASKQQHQASQSANYRNYESMRLANTSL